jgi:hypothetical protein
MTYIYLDNQATIKTIRNENHLSPIPLMVVIEGFNCKYETCLQVNILLIMGDERQKAGIWLACPQVQQVHDYSE